MDSYESQIKTNYFPKQKLLGLSNRREVFSARWKLNYVRIYAIVLKPVFNRRSFIGDASVHLRVSSRGICDGLSDNGADLSPRASVFPCQNYFTNASYTHFHLCDIP